MDLLATNLPIFLIADVVLACLATGLLYDFSRREADYWDGGDLAHFVGGFEGLAGLGFTYLFSCSFVVFTPMAIISTIWLTIFK